MMNSNDTNNKLIELTFSNNSTKIIFIWTEPAAYQIELPPKHEYKLITDDKEFTFEFEDNNLTFWLQNKFGYRLLKKPISQNIWKTDIDTFNI